MIYITKTIFVLKLTLIFVVSLMFGLFVAPYFLKAEATYNNCNLVCSHRNRLHICTDWDWVCITPTLIPTPTATPSATPTPTPVVEEEEPEITPVPTSVPQPLTEPSGPFLAPSCTDQSPILLPANPHVVRSGKTAVVKWFQTQGTEVNIYFKELGQTNWTHGVGNIQAKDFNEYTISHLNPKLGYVFGIQQKTGCSGGETVIAVIVDGPASRVFGFSFWEWSK